MIKALIFSFLLSSVNVSCEHVVSWYFWHTLLTSDFSQKQVKAGSFVWFTVSIKNYRVTTKQAFGCIPSEMSHFLLSQLREKKQLRLQGGMKRCQTTGDVFWVVFCFVLFVCMGRFVKHLNANIRSALLVPFFSG